jgi:hypothetical protein
MLSLTLTLSQRRGNSRIQYLLNPSASDMPNAAECDSLSLEGEGRGEGEIALT